MLVDSIGGYAKQSKKIQARKITTKKLKETWEKSKGKNSLEFA
jgi:hypothetical protein